MNIISSTTQASVRAVLLRILLTHTILLTYAKPIAQMCIQHILLLSVLSTKGVKGSSHHCLPFISTQVILFQQSSQLYSVVHNCFQLHTKIHSKIVTKHKQKYKQFDYLKQSANKYEKKFFKKNRVK